jgi:hypothetical protein
MNYSRQGFFRLMEEVEAQGGQHLDQDHAKVFYSEFAGGPTRDAQAGSVSNNNCGESCLFDVPYVPMGDGNTPMMGTVQVCAQDDMLGLWPRFAKARATEAV